MDLPEKGKEMILMYCDFMMGKLVICAGYPGWLVTVDGAINHLTGGFPILSISMF